MNFRRPVNASILMIFCMTTADSAGFAQSSPPEFNPAEILQVVLNDARSKWRGPIPCISDHLRQFEQDTDLPDRLSELTNVRSPFPICSPDALSVSKGDSFVAISEARHYVDKTHGEFVFVRFDYWCGLCGQGYQYSFQKKEGRWRSLGREGTWVS